MVITESLKGLTENEIRALAKKYNPNDNGPTWADKEIVDIFGTLAKQRKKAYDGFKNMMLKKR